MKAAGAMVCEASASSASSNARMAPSGGAVATAVCAASAIVPAARSMARIGAVPPVRASRVRSKPSHCSVMRLLRRSTSGAVGSSSGWPRMEVVAGAGGS